MMYSDLIDEVRRCHKELKKVEHELSSRAKEKQTWGGGKHAHRIPTDMWRRYSDIQEELEVWNLRADKFLHDKLAAANLEPIRSEGPPAGYVMKLCRTERPGLYSREFVEVNGHSSAIPPLPAERI